MTLRKAGEFDAWQKYYRYPNSFGVQGRALDDESETAHHVAGGINMERIMETIVLVLGLAMVAPLPYEEVIGGYGRLALAVLGFLLIFWWLFRNDHRKDLREAEVERNRAVHLRALEREAAPREAA